MSTWQGLLEKLRHQGWSHVHARDQPWKQAPPPGRAERQQHLWAEPKAAAGLPFTCRTSNLALSLSREPADSHRPSKVAAIDLPDTHTHTHTQP